jgi:hypothetical protein
VGERSPKLGDVAVAERGDDLGTLEQSQTVFLRGAVAHVRIGENVLE